MSLFAVNCRRLKNLGCCCGPSTYSVGVTGSAVLNRNTTPPTSTTFNISNYIVIKCDDGDYRKPCSDSNGYFPNCYSSLFCTSNTKYTQVLPCNSVGNGCSYTTNYTASSGNHLYIATDSSNNPIYLASMRFIKAYSMTESGVPSTGDGCCCRYLVIRFTYGQTWTRTGSLNVRCATIDQGVTGDKYYAIVFTRISSNATDLCNSWEGTYTATNYVANSTITIDSHVCNKARPCPPDDDPPYVLWEEISGMNLTAVVS